MLLARRKATALPANAASVKSAGQRYGTGIAMTLPNPFTSPHFHQTLSVLLLRSIVCLPTNCKSRHIPQYVLEGLHPLPIGLQAYAPLIPLEHASVNQGNQQLWHSRHHYFGCRGTSNVTSTIEVTTFPPDTAMAKALGPCTILIGILLSSSACSCRYYNQYRVAAQDQL